MKLGHIIRQLENLLGKAEIKETLSPGSASSVLPAEKELCRLAHLASKLCELRRRSCKLAVKKTGRKKKESIEYGHNVAAMSIAALKSAGELKNFTELMESGHKPEYMRSR